MIKFYENEEIQDYPISLQIVNGVAVDWRKTYGEYDGTLSNGTRVIAKEVTLHSIWGSTGKFSWLRKHPILRD